MGGDDAEEHFCTQCVDEISDWMTCQMEKTQSEKCQNMEDSEDCGENECMLAKNIYDVCAYTNCSSMCPQCDDDVLKAMECAVKAQSPDGGCEGLDNHEEKEGEDVTELEACLMEQECGDV